MPNVAATSVGTKVPFAGSGGGLSKKIGPLPVWGWAAAIAGLVLVFYYRSVQSGKQSNAAPATVSSDAVTSALAGPGTPASSDTTSSGLDTTASLETNTSWLQKAVNYVTGAGLGQPLEAQTALSNYLQGQPIDNAQASLVNAAIKNVGLAPDGVLGTPTVTPSTSEQIANLYHTYLGRSASAGELAGWVGQVNAGTETVSDIQSKIANSAEAKAHK